tara:strand:+ start:6099 stop:6569 length:471 start_codon:yes stop_codon:yes gene_type:complete
MGGSRRSNRPANPAGQATQPTQTAPMGTAGQMGYGEGEEAMSAQAALGGLPDNRTPVLQGPTGPVAAATSGPPTEALDAALAYTPDIQSLNAPDDMPMIELMQGAEKRKGTEVAIMKQRQNAAASKVFESLMEDNPDDPDLAFAADRLRLLAGKYI